MSAVLRVRSDDGTMIDIPVIKGDKGDTGDKGDQGEQGIQGPPGKDGKDGYSPKLTVTDIVGGHRVTIINESSKISFDVLDTVATSYKASTRPSTTITLDDSRKIKAFLAYEPGFYFASRSDTKASALVILDRYDKVVFQSTINSSSGFSFGTPNSADYASFLAFMCAENVPLSVFHLPITFP